jgi:hypothetical protein
VTKALLTEFVYNNNVHSTINMSFFFVMYDFYLNILSSVKDNRLKSEVPVTRKKAEKFENGMPSNFRKSDTTKNIFSCTSL